MFREFNEFWECANSTYKLLCGEPLGFRANFESYYSQSENYKFKAHQLIIFENLFI